MERAVSYLYELSAAAGGGVVTSNGGQLPPQAGGPASPGLSVNSQLGPGVAEPHHLMAPANENYCLRWNEFEKKYAESFRHLRDNEYFTDVTLTTEGHSVKAHRVILSACSTYFHAILKSMAPWQHPVLMLQDVKPQDLNALMDFIYFGQVHMSQDSLPTFLKIAERLKIKGLCETLSPISMPPTPTQIQPGGSRVQAQMNQMQQAAAATGMPPMANSPHALVTTANVSNNMASATANFENLLPRSPYIPPDVNATASCNAGSSLTGSNLQPPPPPPRSSAPPAHQSPKQVRSASNPRPESLVYVSPAKRTKYSSSSVQSGPLSPQSILRNQLQLAKEIGGGHPGGPNSGGNADNGGVEVKSEPMAILSSQEDVPSSGVNVQELMSSHEGDLASLSAAIPQGISPHFMFSPDPDGASGSGGGGGGGPGSNGGQTLVAVEDRSGGPGGTTTVRMVEASSLASSGIVTSGSVVTSVNVSGGHAAGILVPTSHHIHHSHLPSHSQQVQQQQQQQQASHHQQQLHHQQQGQQQQQHHQQQQQHQQHQQEQHQHHVQVSELQQQTEHMHMQQQQQQQQQQQLQNQQTHHFVQAEMHKEEPQDLTPAQHESSPGGSHGGTPSSVGVPHTPTNHGMNSPSTPTPPKNNGSNGGTPTGPPGSSDKKTGARKSCPYCNKDFHEMSLKRHIKDVHFRSQNTFVICPQCCKQYASQNSLYSHLNRVHNVKKDVMGELQLPMATGSGASNNGSVASGSAGSAHGGQHNDHSNHHDGMVVNLAHHSDSSNG